MREMVQPGSQFVYKNLGFSNTFKFFDFWKILGPTIYQQIHH